MELSNSASMHTLFSPADWQSFAHTRGLNEAQKLAVTADEFEATLVRQYLKEAMKPLVQGVLNENGTAQEIYRGFLTDALAGEIVRGGPGLGVSNALQTQLSNLNTNKETDAS